METYFLNDKLDELMITIGGGAATVDYWSERKGGYEPTDTSAEFLEDVIINRLSLSLVVGERLGWREMGNEHSNTGYFAVTEAVE